VIAHFENHADGPAAPERYPDPLPRQQSLAVGECWRAVVEDTAQRRVYRDAEDESCHGVQSSGVVHNACGKRCG